MGDVAGSVTVVGTTVVATVAGTAVVVTEPVLPPVVLVPALVVDVPASLVVAVGFAVVLVGLAVVVVGSAVVVVAPTWHPGVPWPGSGLQVWPGVALAGPAVAQKLNTMATAIAPANANPNARRQEGRRPRPLVHLEPQPLLTGQLLSAAANTLIWRLRTTPPGSHRRDRPSGAKPSQILPAICIHKQHAYVNNLLTHSRESPTFFRLRPTHLHRTIRGDATIGIPLEKPLGVNWSY